MQIDVFGTGCPKCKTLYNNVQKALAELKIAADLVKVEDINQIVQAGVMMTPALAIDGEVKSSGRVLSVAEIKELLA